MYILKCRLCNNSNLFTILAPYTCDCFISMYSFMAIVGIMRYLSKEQEWAAGDFFCCGLIFPVVPISPMFLDGFFGFYFF